MVYCVILGAGNNLRFDSKLPKILNLINKKPIYQYVLDTCLSNKQIDKIVFVVNNKIINKIETNKKIETIIGSKKSRQESLINVINYLKKQIKQNDIVITLDADRPFISNTLINKSINVAKKYNAANTILPIYDSIIKDLKYINRNNVFAVQTPQTFKFKVWKNIKNSRSTDLFTYFNYKLNKNNLVLGELTNFKITTKDDFEFAKKIKFNK